jgi:hypothetical protein
MMIKEILMSVQDNFYDMFLIQNALRQGVALSPLLFNFSLEYAVKIIQENQVGLKLNGTRHFLPYADDVYLYKYYKIIGTSIYDGKEVDLQVNIEQTR